MRTFLLSLLLATAVTMPAYAEWTFHNMSDERGDLVVASALDTEDMIELQIVCDELFEGDLLFSLLLNEPYRESSADALVEISATVAPDRFNGLAADYMEIDGTLAIDVMEDRAPQVRDLVEAILEGERNLWVIYPGGRAEFEISNVLNTVGRVHQACS